MKTETKETKEHDKAFEIDESLYKKSEFRMRKMVKERWLL